MIRINLLPEEYRRSEGTSPKVFASVLAAVVMVCCSLGWFGYVYFGELGRLELEHAQKSEHLATLTPQVGYFDSLQAETKDFKQREKTIEQISKSRVLWTRIVDELIDTIDNKENADRHVTWFRSMSVKDGDQKKGPQVVMPGFVQGDDVARMSDFHDDLVATPFFRYVKDKSLPGGNIVEDPKRRPSEAFSTSLNWSFHPTVKWAEIDAGKPK